MDSCLVLLTKGPRSLDTGDLSTGPPLKTAISDPTRRRTDEVDGRRTTETGRER